ncbi:MAG: flagellar biosynthetic protein FliR [Rhodocyclaceae bacterium]
MLTVTSAQLDAWIAALVFPLARILALTASAPVFGNAAAPRRIRLLAGLAIGFAVIPSLGPPPAIAPASGAGLLLLAQQIVIGLAMGLAMRAVFAAVDLAGELIGLQMGLSFAVFFDPQSASESSALSEFLAILATLVFLALNGHLMLLAGVSASFEMLPIGPWGAPVPAFELLVRWGATIFSAGVLLSLPLIAALLVTNIALGVLTRAAPQLNLFAVGFPVTMTVGFGVLLLSLPLAAPVLETLFGQGLGAIDQIVRAASRP